MSREVDHRLEKMQELRDAPGVAFPNDFQVSHSLDEIVKAYGDVDAEGLKAKESEVFNIAGRIRFQNSFGKSAFVRIHDRSGKLQIYVKQNVIGKELYQSFKGWDVGDIVGAKGTLFRTKTGELTLMVQELRLLTKSLRPLPEKWHGLTDQEMRYRQRYVDLMVNDDTRLVFQRRSAIVKSLRAFFSDRDFLEVETPMLHPIAGGATAKPFVTHHNALNMPLYLRIAPELYLKRLVVGGLERVFEINRSFRNEGLSTRHNPEFTMLEFYQAYARYGDLINLTEELFEQLAVEVLGNAEFSFQGKELSFKAPFKKMKLRESLVEVGGLTPEEVGDAEVLRAKLEKTKMNLAGDNSLGRLQYLAFEAFVEPTIWQPTFITDFPVEVSPLARRQDDDPSTVERFELFMGGMEVANGFSELNDPQDQQQRFMEQVEAKKAGDEEACEYDADYIRALEYGLPPTAGQGIGIDRLVMLLTDQASIRDVILFPLMRPESI